MAFPLINPSHQFFDTSGSPLVGGTLEFRDPTTNNLINSYPTADDADAQTNANDNPLTLDARGGFAGLYLEDGVKYKIVLKDANGSTVDTQDDVRCPLHPWGGVATAAENAASVTPTDFSYEPGNVLRYGGAGDDATNNATAFQAACDQAINDGAPVFIPAGTYKIGSTVTITGSMQIGGAGRLSTLLKKTFDTTHLFEIDSDDAIIARDMAITSTVTQTGGAYFHVDGGSASTLNKYSRFVNLRIGTFYDGIWFEDAAGYAVEDCYFVETSHVAIQVGAVAPQEVDNGDGQISGCIFDTSDNTGTYAIRQFAAGGLRVINNKFLNHEFQYSCQMGAGLTTSILIINGNSFENPGTTNIGLEEISTGSFGQVVITSNQITANGSGYGMNLQDINNLMVGNNNIQVGSGATAAMILQNVDEFMIAPNLIDGNAASVGISIDASCTNGRVAVQEFNSLTTNISNSGPASVIVDKKQLHGSVTWDIANMASDGDTEAKDVTVTGAKTGDVCAVSLSSLGANAILLSCNARANDTVYVVALNKTGGASNPASGTLKATVWTDQ